MKYLKIDLRKQYSDLRKTIYYPILEIEATNEVIQITINTQGDTYFYGCKDFQTAEFVAEKIINSDQKIWTEDQIQDMNYKKIRSERIAKREKPINVNRCPKCNNIVIIVPLSPNQSCQLCPNCQWIDFGREK